MASTPPPLPSSSEDSDFDDDDFGCFSAAPVKATTKALQNVGKKNNDDVNDTPDGAAATETATVKDSSLGENNKALDGSDDVVCAGDQSELVKPKEEQLATDLFASDQFDEGVLSEPSQASTIESLESQKGEEQNDFSGISHGAVDSKEAGTIEQAANDINAESDLQDRNETVEHSNIESTETNVEFIEEDNSVPLADSKLNCDDVPDDSDTNCNQAQGDVNAMEEPTELPCESQDGDEEDDFGGWSDMQTFQSDEAVDSEITQAQNDSFKNEDIEIDSNSSEILNDNAATGEEEKDSISVSPPSSHSPCHDSPNIPLELESDKASEETGHNQCSNPPDNSNAVDDDDGFGDFADFSSNQINDSGKDETVHSLSFKTSGTDDKEKGGDDSNDAGDTGVYDHEKCDSNEETVGGVNNDVDDDFDEDWGFKSAETNDNGNGSDDFGNFGSADNANGDSDWASFNDATTTQATVANDDDDDFDDFSESDFQAPTFSQTESMSSKVQESASKVEKVVYMCFPEDISLAHQTLASQKQEDSCDTSVDVIEIDNLCSVVEMGLKVTPKAKEETWTIVKELRNKDPVVGTWGRLKDVNSSHALDYGWNSSHCCQEIFSTLHIDTKNVLFSQKKQAVPFYASGLGILEPIRGGPNPTEKNQSPAAPTPALLDTTSKPDDTKKSLDIPPVDFDWGSSGLTNPLKVFKNDSFNNGISSLEPFSDVLHKNIEPTKELSGEAKSILSKIPNLNFMRSNVLMFPIKD